MPMQTNTLSEVPAVEAPDAAFQEQLDGLSAESCSLWWRSPTALPDFGAEIPRRRQRRNERAIDDFADRIEGELVVYPRTDRQRWHDRQRRALREFGARVLPLPAAEQAVIFSDDYFDATARFAREARAFDPGMETADLSQALRNVWIMHLFQLLLDRRIAYTTPILAYSLLYPYTDNRLDDPALTAPDKRRFCRRLGRRLAGERLLSEDSGEMAVFRLIGRIEEALPRAGYPDVYRSLLAIHDAQTRSLAQQGQTGRHPEGVQTGYRPGGVQTTLCEPRILRLSVEKGGASVLADAYLVAGELDRREAEFFFGYGVFLQLADDLQDVEEDLRCGHATVFSRRARGGRCLDPLANRLVHFLDAVLASARFSAGRHDVLRSLIRHSCVQLIVESAGQQPRWFSAPYLRLLGRRSMTRFSYGRKQRGKLRARYRKINARLSRQTSMASIFEALGTAPIEADHQLPDAPPSSWVLQTARTARRPYTRWARRLRVDYGENPVPSLAELSMT